MEHEGLRAVVLELFLGGLDEERLGEERMPRTVGDHAQLEPVLRIGSGEGIDDVELTILEVREDLGSEALELILLDRLVDLSPPEAFLRLWLADEELVL